MTLFILLLSCHHTRPTDNRDFTLQSWDTLEWSLIADHSSWSVQLDGVDELEVTAKAATAMLALQALEGLGDQPVVLGRETVGWGGGRCFSTALSMPDRDSCYLIPNRLSTLDPIWLYHRDWPSAVRPIVHGSAHGLTLVCSPKGTSRSLETPISTRTRIVGVPGGVTDYDQCPNAMTLASSFSESSAWVRFQRLDIPLSRLALLYDEPATRGTYSAAERLWEAYVAHSDDENFYRFRDQISGVQVILSSTSVHGEGTIEGVLYDLNGSGFYELEVRGDAVGGYVGYFDGNEDGRTDSCWIWSLSSELIWATDLVLGANCSGSTLSP